MNILDSCASVNRSPRLAAQTSEYVEGIALATSAGMLDAQRRVLTTLPEKVRPKKEDRHVRRHPGSRLEGQRHPPAGDGLPGGDVLKARAELTRWKEWYPF